MYFNWGAAGQAVYSNTTTPNQAILPGDGRYEKVNRMFYGISEFNLSRPVNRLFNFQGNDNYGSIGTGYNSDYGTYEVTVSYFWIAVRGCNLTAQEWFVVTNQTCVCKDCCLDSTVFETLPGSARFCQVCHYTCYECNKGAMK